jgi:hypothetical protein
VLQADTCGAECVLHARCHEHSALFHWILSPGLGLRVCTSCRNQAASKTQRLEKQRPEFGRCGGAEPRLDKRNVAGRVARRQSDRHLIKVLQAVWRTFRETRGCIMLLLAILPRCIASLCSIDIATHKTCTSLPRLLVGRDVTAPEF